MSVLFDERVDGALTLGRSFDTLSGDPGQKALQMAKEVGVVIDLASVIESNARAENVLHMAQPAGQQAIRGYL